MRYGGGGIAQKMQYDLFTIKHKRVHSFSYKNKVDKNIEAQNHWNVRII